MVSTVISAVFLGNLVAFNADQDENSEPDQHVNSLLNTYGSFSAPLSDGMFELTLNSAADSLYAEDHFDLKAIDSLTYDIGAGEVTDDKEAGQLAGATITFANGFSVVSAVQVVQVSSGDSFLLISDSQKAPYGQQTIQSVEITSLFHATRGFAPTGYEGASFAICFCNGTSVRTARGSVLIETLRVGDLVECDGKGMRPVRWIGCRVVGRPELERHENLRPIRITAGALGNGLPKRDLLISQQHRVMVTSLIAERMFGESDVLIAANKLTALAGVFVDYTVEQFAYFHMLFDEHEVIFAENIPSESLLLGEQAMKALDTRALNEIREVFPRVLDGDERPNPARTIPKGRMQRKLVQRHLRNKKSFVEDRSVLAWMVA